MKKLAVFVLILVLGSGSTFANDKNDNPAKNLSQQIALLLENPEISIQKEEIKASIEFTINTHNEIVVLTVNSEVNSIQQYVKSRLNYQKVKTDLTYKANKTFKIDLKIKRS